MKIREQRGGQIRWAEDLGGRFTNEQGVDVIRLFNRKEELAAPPFGFYDFDDKKSSVLELFSPKSGVYIPIKHVATGVAEKLYLSDSSVDEWAALKRKELMRLTKPKENWWDKYIPLFGLLGIAAMLMISLIITFNSIPTALSSAGTLAQANLETSKNILEIYGSQTHNAIAPPAVGG